MNIYLCLLQAKTLLDRIDSTLKETIQFNLHNNVVTVITTSNVGRLSLRGVWFPKVTSESVRTLPLRLQTPKHMPCSLHWDNGCSSSLSSEELNEFLGMELFCSSWVVKSVRETWSLHKRRPWAELT